MTLHIRWSQKKDGRVHEIHVGFAYGKQIREACGNGMRWGYLSPRVRLL